jgi:hypothetical protein
MSGKRFILLIIATIFGAGVLLAVIGGMVGTDDSSTAGGSVKTIQTTPVSDNTGSTVEFIVTGSPAYVIYSTGSVSHKGHSPMHITKQLAPNASYTISSSLKRHGYTACTIKVDNKTISHSRAGENAGGVECGAYFDTVTKRWTSMSKPAS